MLPEGRQRLRPQRPPCTKLFDDLIRVSDLPELLPLGRNGAKLSVSAIWRWRRKGRDGRRLPIITIAAVAYVRREDLLAFLAPSPTSDNHTDEPPGLSNHHPGRQHGRQHKAVEDALAQEFGV
jgi:hypothetical protein